jgi:hypothetical protein
MYRGVVIWGMLCAAVALTASWAKRTGRLLIASGAVLTEAAAERLHLPAGQG